MAAVQHRALDTSGGEREKERGENGIRGGWFVFRGKGLTFGSMQSGKATTWTCPTATLQSASPATKKPSTSARKRYSRRRGTGRVFATTRVDTRTQPRSNGGCTEAKLK